MDAVVKVLVEILPFGEWLQLIGLSEKESLAIATIINALIIWGIISLIKFTYARLKRKIAERNLHPQFDYLSIKNATQFYIPTQYQNANPGKEDEPQFSHKYVSRSPLIPFFLKTGFNQKRDSERFYLILADSGMGKTTFMINLYMSYTSFWNFRRGKNEKMKLFRLGEPDTLDLVKEIKRDEAKNTLLLLDALDEDPYILPQEDGISDNDAFRKRVDEIIEATRNFKEVVITCRTQYFPGQEDDPYELKVKRPDEKGYFTLNKLYISPFDDGEVSQYLNKKYRWWQLWKLKSKAKARQIVKNSPKLVVRPMLLNYIDLLLEEKKEFKTVYEIYEAMVGKWLQREAEKRKPTKEQPAFIENLRKLSQDTALFIFSNRLIKKVLYLDKIEIFALSEKYKIELKRDEITGKSLLTCDGGGNWKFAHKSVFEYFIAQYAKRNIDFHFKLLIMNFLGLDMTKIFLGYQSDANFPIEFFENSIEISKGDFKFQNKYNIQIADFYMWKCQVTQAEYLEITGKKNPSYFKENEMNPVEQVSWYDAIEYCNLLNAKIGLPPSYDKEGTLLNTEGNVTQQIREVKGFRLPTEAEWEYAAGGGSQNLSDFAGIDKENDLRKYAWYSENSEGKTHPVGELKPNSLGLHDMSGNVWEWCTDWYDKDATWHKTENGVVSNPVNLKKNDMRCLRGGSWYDNAAGCRMASRDAGIPAYRGSNVGFRVVFVP